MDYQDKKNKSLNDNIPENAADAPDFEASENNTADMEEIEEIIEEIKRENEEDLEEESEEDFEEDYEEEYDEEAHESDSPVPTPSRNNKPKKYGRYEDNDEDLDDTDEEPYVYNPKGDTGDFIFKVLAGILVFAICITAVVAVLLATGRLNGLIDKLNTGGTENAQAESTAEPTPTVRVTLTPTPADTSEPTPEPTETAEPTKAPTTAPDSSKASDTESTASSEDVMTFNEVNDEVTAKETTNLRNVPSQGEESFIVYILQNGETVHRTGMSDEGWSRLEYEGQVVYAMSNLLTTDLTKKETTESGVADTSGETELVVRTTFTEVNDLVTPKIEVNLRLLPSVTNPNATVVAKIKNGEVVTRTGINEELGWCRVEYNGQTLYCISSYVEPVASEAAPAEGAAEAAPAA